jgi:hypothetical protein
LAIWALIAFAVTGTLASAHEYTLPRPANSEAVARALAGQRRVRDRGRYLIHHILYLECSCSQRIIQHLLARRALPDAAERLVLVGTDAELARRAADAGYDVEQIRPGALESRYHVTSAPLLLVSDPSDALVYLGGYTRVKQGPEIRDLSIVAELRSGRRALELPLLGCAVSRSLQMILDPFGLKYSSTPVNGTRP